MKKNITGKKSASPAGTADIRPARTSRSRVRNWTDRTRTATAAMRTATAPDTWISCSVFLTFYNKAGNI